MKFKKNQFQPLQELEMPDFRREEMGPNPYPQMGQMYQRQGQRPFTQMGGRQSYQRPGPQLTQPRPAGVQVPPMPSGQRPSPSIPGMRRLSNPTLKTFCGSIAEKWQPYI